MATNLIIIILLFVCGTLSDSGIKGPPHVTGNVASRQTFRLGETIKLDCPIRGTPTPIIEWSKDGDSVSAGWERFKPTNHGLRIKEVILDDSGEYTCKGVNGFGSTQVTFEIVIVDPNAKATEPPPPSETLFGPDLVDVEDPDISWKQKTKQQQQGGSSPLLIETSHVPAGRLWQLPVDSTLRLKCVAQGEPEPHLIWLKDGREIGEERRLGRWELQVARLNVDDSGTYSCKAVNPYGSINASFSVQVIDRSMRKPEFVGFYPQNVTVTEGSSPRLQCRVVSESPLFLQWLKRLDRVGPTNSNHLLDPEGILQFEGWRYRVLRSGHPAFQTEDGSYLDKLALDDVSGDQSGLYVCVATNGAGYAYREAIVNVLSSSGRPLSDGSIGNYGGLTTTAVIALPVSALVFLAITCGIVFYVKSEKKSSRITKESSSPHPHNKDLSTTPCLPPPTPRPIPIAPPQPPMQNCMPYSTPFMGSVQHPEMMRMHHTSGRSGGAPSCQYSPAVAGTSSSSGASSGLLYLNGSGNWSNAYRPQPCGRSMDRTNMGGHPYYQNHREGVALMGGGLAPSESEHAYASVQGDRYDDLRPINVHQPLMRNHLPFNNNSSNHGQQRIEMV